MIVSGAIGTILLTATDIVTVWRQERQEEQRMTFAVMRKGERMSDLISRQAAIDTTWEDPSYTDPLNVLSEVRDRIKDLPSAQPERRWIPCSERLPEEENKSYWICTDGGYQCECRWTNVNHFWTNLTTDWHWHIMDVPQYSKVVAWMPLPEPYKGGEHE